MFSRMFTLYQQMQGLAQPETLRQQTFGKVEGERIVLVLHHAIPWPHQLQRSLGDLTVTLASTWTLRQPSAAVQLKEAFALEEHRRLLQNLIIIDFDGPHAILSCWKCGIVATRIQIHSQVQRLLTVWGFWGDALLQWERHGYIDRPSSVEAQKVSTGQTVRTRSWQGLQLLIAGCTTVHGPYPAYHGCTMMIQCLCKVSCSCLSLQYILIAYKIHKLIHNILCCLSLQYIPVAICSLFKIMIPFPPELRPLTWVPNISQEELRFSGFPTTPTTPSQAPKMWSTALAIHAWRAQCDGSPRTKDAMHPIP